MPKQKQDNNYDRLSAHPDVAIVLTSDLTGPLESEPELARVGTLPVLLRAILGVQSTRPARIVVVSRGISGPRVPRELLSTQRLPAQVEWMNVASDLTLSSIVRQVGADGDRLLVVAGDRLYNPTLHRIASAWDEKTGALELASGDDPVGLFSLSREASMKLAADSTSRVVTLQDLHRWIAHNAMVVECRQVETNLWQKISTPQDRIVAEQKLIQWLVKPTDGIFARMNRRISIPISLQIAKFPITPNMVSLFTLGVSFASGILFALGGYWDTLAGAVLSVWASILDGCDGEIARLKLQASDFGTWLETFCDYLYYLFMFAGMAIGLARSKEDPVYLTWGGVLFFGAIITFFTASLSRKGLAGKHPEQFLAVWQKKAESRISNPLLYVGRYTEFIIRRCFLPYAILAFSLANLTRVALYMSAVGANLAWIISLYSYVVFFSKSADVARINVSTRTKPTKAEVHFSNMGK
jgi:phosphatidylglycerophosphate synthase